MLYQVFCRKENVSMEVDPSSSNSCCSMVNGYSYDMMDFSDKDAFFLVGSTPKQITKKAQVKLGPQNLFASCPISVGAIVSISMGRIIVQEP